jgi:hypothetical protein
VIQCDILREEREERGHKKSPVTRLALFDARYAMAGIPEEE